MQLQDVSQIIINSLISLGVIFNISLITRIIFGSLNFVTAVCEDDYFYNKHDDAFETLLDSERVENLLLSERAERNSDEGSRFESAS